MQNDVRELRGAKGLSSRRWGRHSACRGRRSTRSSRAVMTHPCRFANQVGPLLSGGRVEEVFHVNGEVS